MNNITRQEAEEKAKREMNTILYMVIEDLKESESMAIHQFGKVFYDESYSRETDALGYLKGKYIRYLQDGFIGAYGRLDTKNRMRVIEWLTEIAFSYVGIPDYLEKRIKND